MDLEKFLERVDRTGDCWMWTGTLNNGGYGVLSVKGISMRAHRLSWELHNGRIPDGPGYHGTVVAHKCDVRACVNPAHLFLTDQSGNLLDCREKGRAYKAFGEEAGRAVLTEKDVEQIRARALSGEERGSIAKDFGITNQSVVDICSGKTWRHLPHIPVEAAPTVPDHSNAKPNSGSFKPGREGIKGPRPELRTADYDRIASLLESGMSQREIARVCGTTHPTVARVARTLGKEMANPFRRMTEDDRARIRDLAKSGYTQQEIADITGVSRPTVSRTLTAAGG
jgi:DNA-binding CsgD family transcriptional regulator